MVKRTEGENEETLAPPMRQIKIRFSQRQRERVCVEKKRKYWAKMKRKHVYEGRKKKKKKKGGNEEAWGKGWLVMKRQRRKIEIEVRER